MKLSEFKRDWAWIAGWLLVIGLAAWLLVWFSIAERATLTVLGIAVVLVLAVGPTRLSILTSRAARFVAPAVRQRKLLLVLLGFLLAAVPLAATLILLRPSVSEDSDWYDALTWLQVAPLYGLIILLAISLLVWVSRARKRFAVEEVAGIPLFLDAARRHENEKDQKRNDSHTSSGKSLATLLVNELARLRELYAAVDDRAIGPEASRARTGEADGQYLPAPPRLPTIQTADPSALIEPAIATGAKLTVWKFEIPLGMFLSLFNRLLVGPRIAIGMHRDREELVLDARLVGGRRSGSWRVRRELGRPADPVAQAPGMIMELAELIFCDLSVVGSVSDPAARAFLQGLRSYHDSFGLPEESALYLRRATRWFREAAGADAHFHLAHYNLGLVYHARGRHDSAERCFERAILRDPARAEPYYALAKLRYERGRKSGNTRSGG